MCIYVCACDIRYSKNYFPRLTPVVRLSRSCKDGLPGLLRILLGESESHLQQISGFLPGHLVQRTGAQTTLPMLMSSHVLRVSPRLLVMVSVCLSVSVAGHSLCCLSVCLLVSMRSVNLSVFLSLLASVFLFVTLLCFTQIKTLQAINE